MTATEVVQAARISDVWRALGGPEPMRGRACAFWRAGDNPQAVALDDEKGCWYDHRDHVGGGLLDLIQHVRGGTRAEALNWLADLTGAPLDDRPPRALAERRAVLQIRQEAQHFASAARIMAETALESLPTDSTDRVVYTALLADLHTSPMAEYLAWLDRQPHMAAALLHAGRQRDRRVQISLAKYLMAEVADAA